MAATSLPWAEAPPPLKKHHQGHHSQRGSHPNPVINKLIPTAILQRDVLIFHDNNFKPNVAGAVVQSLCAQRSVNFRDADFANMKSYQFWEARHLRPFFACQNEERSREVQQTGVDVAPYEMLSVPHTWSI